MILGGVGAVAGMGGGDGEEQVEASNQAPIGKVTLLGDFKQGGEIELDISGLAYPPGSSGYGKTIKIDSVEWFTSDDITGNNWVSVPGSNNKNSIFLTDNLEEPPGEAQNGVAPSVWKGTGQKYVGKYLQARVVASDGENTAIADHNTPTIIANIDDPAYDPNNGSGSPSFTLSDQSGGSPKESDATDASYETTFVNLINYADYDNPVGWGLNYMNLDEENDYTLTKQTGGDGEWQDVTLTKLTSNENDGTPTAISYIDIDDGEAKLYLGTGINAGNKIKIAVTVTDALGGEETFYSVETNVIA